MVALRAANVMGTHPYQRKQLEEVLLRGLRPTHLPSITRGDRLYLLFRFATSPGENSK